MTDLITFMDSMSLSECKREIDNQFEGIAHHKNIMKLAVLSSFIMTGAMSIIKDVDPHRFLESLKEELEKEVKEADSLNASQVSYMEHLEKNQELITNFESRRQEIYKISEDLEILLKKYDKKLQEIAADHCKKSIAEIEAML